MKKPSLPSLSHTLHQIAVGTIATVIGTIVALLIWQLVEDNQGRDSNTTQLSQSSGFEESSPRYQPRRAMKIADK